MFTATNVGDEIRNCEIAGRCEKVDIACCNVVARPPLSFQLGKTLIRHDFHPFDIVIRFRRNEVFTAGVKGA